MTINFAPAEDCIADLLTRFGSLDGVTDVNCSNGGVALRRDGRSEPVDIPVLDDEIAELGNLMASALDLDPPRELRRGWLRRCRNGGEIEEACEHEEHHADLGRHRRRQVNLAAQ